jgi:hypothetical protein
MRRTFNPAPNLYPVDLCSFSRFDHWNSGKKGVAAHKVRYFLLITNETKIFLIIQAHVISGQTY